MPMGNVIVSDTLRAEIADFLDGLAVMSVATSGADVPWGALVFYARDDDLNLFFLSSPKARHSVNIAGNLNVAVTIIGDETDWLKMRGAQIDGTTARVVSSELSYAAEVYFGRYPGFREMVGIGQDADEEALVEALQRAHLYKISPRMIRLIDNGKGFAHKEELSLGGVQAKETVPSSKRFARDGSTTGSRRSLTPRETQRRGG